MNDTNETERTDNVSGKADISMGRLAALTPGEIEELAEQLAKDMIALGDVRIAEQALQCVMCGTPQAVRITLLGGYNTTLCQIDRNHWHTFVEDSPEAVTYESANLRLEIAIRNGKEPEAITYSAGAKKAKKSLFELAKRWIENG